MELTGKTYTCSAGETFDSVSLTLFGNERCAADLLAANPAHVGTVIFKGGEVLSVPYVTATDDPSSVAPWKR